MDLRLLEKDPNVKVLRRWLAMEGQVVYLIYEREGRCFYATSWEIDGIPREVYYDAETGDFQFKNGFRWNSRTRNYEYYELPENPFAHHPGER